MFLNKAVTEMFELRIVRQAGTLFRVSQWKILL